MTTQREPLYSPNVPTLADELHMQLLRYIEAQYPLRHPTLVAERHALLETAGVISQQPFIESTPGYVTGASYHELRIPSSLAAALEELASLSSDLVPAHLYQHQAAALEAFLGQDHDLIVSTGTGSGKTETFLLPILARSFEEATKRPRSYQMPGMRALLLYPMNALVNDQLTRLRRLFGNPRFISWLQQRHHAPRPLRFGMYTSRTPYPGLASEEKNRQRLLPLLEYYLQLEAEQSDQAEELKSFGRWPMLNLEKLRTQAHSGVISVSGSDIELYARHQMQRWCPDVLVTNYSMLEYMLMRPIERSLFQQTAEWLAQDQANTLLIVLDEAHLYSGVTGTEISLLLRRLQARLGIDRSRARYILTSASLDTGTEGQQAILDFAAALAGFPTRPGSKFSMIQGRRMKAPTLPAKQVVPKETEGAILSKFDLQTFSARAVNQARGYDVVGRLATQLGWPPLSQNEDVAQFLGHNLLGLGSFCRLWEITTGQAVAFQQLASQLFPELNQQEQGTATSALLAMAAAATTQDGRSLLPVRAHLFFRGLPPVYACINPHCNARRIAGSKADIGALWLSSRLHCTCGARVYELYGHRNCGAVFLRAFAPSEPANFYWHEPDESGKALRDENNETLLLVGRPHPKATNAGSIYLHTMTGRVLANSRNLINQEDEPDWLLVYRPIQAASDGKTKKERKDEADEENSSDRPRWKSCPVCRKRLQGSSITSLSTKGEQPFVNLVRRQFELQPPSAPAHDAMPNMGRKVLLFSDGRQRAARLARDLPREVELDTFRQALLLAVHRCSERNRQPVVRIDNALYREFVAVCGEYRLHFFDGDSQAELLRRIQELRELYDLDAALAGEDGWEPSIPQGYRVALLRQVADPFYSMQRMCAAVMEPQPNSLKLLKKKPIFSRLDESDLRALVVNWIAALLEESAFDGAISPADRKDTVPGEGLATTSGTATSGWNEAEKAAEIVLGYARSELPQLRQALVDEFCETKDGIAFLKPEKVGLRLTLEDSWYQCSDCAQLIWLPLGGRCPNPHCGGSQLVQLPGDDPAIRARTDFYREPLRQVISEERVPVHLTAEEHTAQLSYRDAQQISTTTEQYELRFQDIGVTAEHPAIDILSCTTTMEVGVDIGTLLGIGLRTMPPRRANYQQRAGRAGRRGSALSTVLAYSENGSHDAHYFVHPDEMIAGVLPCPQISRVNERLIRRHIQAALIQTFFLEYVQSRPTDRHYGYLAEALGTAKAFFTSSESYGLHGFEKWVKKLFGDNSPLLARYIAAWLPDTPAPTTINERQKHDFVQATASALIEKLHDIGEQLYPLREMDHAEAQNDQFRISGEESMLLDTLFEHGFLPTYAFPREVRSFVIEEWKPGNKGSWRIGIKQRPQQSVDIALSEYAPGRELIVDKVTYRVGGIYVDPFPGATLANRVPSLFRQVHHSFALCFACGYTRIEPASSGDGGITRQCPLCNGPLAIQEILDPPDFAPERAKALERQQIHNDSSMRSGTVTEAKLVIPLTDADDFRQKTAEGRVAWNVAEHRELLLVNSGVGGEGFSICRSCGSASPGDPAWLHQIHDRPFLVPQWMAVSRKCNATDGIWHGYLGHRFHSDLLLLRFVWPRGVAYEVGKPWMRDALDTIAQSLLLAATRLLDVAPSELQVGWGYTMAAGQQVSLPRMVDFFLYDTLSGGAGYATQVGRFMDALLAAAQQYLDFCPEQCERSCYRCLRSYANRMMHKRLDRHLASVLLRAIIQGQPPGQLTTPQQAAQLEMLRQFLELSGGIECQTECVIQGTSVPLLVKAARGKYMVGSYPVQRDIQAVKHPLSTLPASQVRLVSDYELVHNLPKIAQSLT
ncbi:MAG TPA: DEAD/DEAH box helicase [Ktedonobacteraceae bacterium]|nr:DEAD/DEAH box helicase [Ktedonobacteraceae bacterium]